MWLIMRPTSCYFVINHNIWSIKTASSFLRSNKKGDKSVLPMSLALQTQTSATPNNKFYHKPEGKKKTLRTHFLQRPIPRPVILKKDSDPHQTHHSPFASCSGSSWSFTCKHRRWKVKPVAFYQNRSKSFEEKRAVISIQAQKQNVLMQICVFQVALGRVRVYADYHTYCTHTGCMNNDASTRLWSTSKYTYRRPLEYDDEPVIGCWQMFKFFELWNLCVVCVHRSWVSRRYELLRGIPE